jgi:hypothetical protein
MDPALAKKIAVGALAAFGLIYFFKARKSAERCRRVTFDDMVRKGYDSPEALQRAYQYCGEAGGEPIAKAVP